MLRLWQPNVRCCWRNNPINMVMVVLGGNPYNALNTGLNNAESARGSLEALEILKDSAGSGGNGGSGGGGSHQLVEVTVVLGAMLKWWSWRSGGTGGGGGAEHLEQCERSLHRWPSAHNPVILEMGDAGPVKESKKSRSQYPVSIHLNKLSSHCCLVDLSPYLEHPIINNVIVIFFNMAKENHRKREKDS